MASKQRTARWTDDLRKRAEALLTGRPVDYRGLSVEEAAQLTHEVQVHQIQLEMQNEELRRTHEELEAARDRYAALYDFAPVAYVTLDFDGTIVEANLTAADLLKVERNELVGQPFSRFVTAEEQDTYYLHRRQILNGQSHTCELTLMTGGRNRLRALLANAIFDGDDDAPGHCRTVISDVTERRRLEEELATSRTRHSVLTLTNGIAHDFNNLLTAVMGYVSLTQLLTGLPPKATHHLAEADKGLVEMRDLIRQLFTLSSPGTSDKRTTAIGPIMERSCRLALAGGKIHHQCAIPQGLWPVVVDEAMIGRAIHNVVCNAREALRQQGDVRLAAENRVLEPGDMDTLRPGRYVRVSVADQGIGIPRENLPRIFDPYFSTKPRGTQKGQGLGLTTAQSIIHDHGGAITVESEAGAGTTIHIYLPAVEEANQPVAVDVEHPRPVLGAGRILVMDDHDLVRKGVRLLLANLGYTTAVARDGREAVRLYRQALKAGERFDVVILDLTVRSGTGAEDTIKRLLALDPKVTALVSSGFLHDPVMTRFRDHGFRGVLPKPYTIDELARTLRTVLADR